ncbi:coil containing protein [Vibrio phage 2.117.O._10N.261.45.E9]|nr:coil containing protein [Vibrio phage 1.117.O._10N.261.45.E9]AUR95431.1 coil containing protein [Vibrio phage 1.207.B._10N.222.51.C2]AUS02322.1 coil containing protein [Vibrio phage 2.117.O._10N.261.45.E9]
MKLRYSYATQEEIPAGYEALYTESGGKWLLTGVEGLKTPEDVSRLQESLRKEREDHKQAKTRLAAFGDIDGDELQTKLDRLDELEKTGGTIDDTKIDELVEARIVTRLNPLKRELAKAVEDKETLEAQNKDYSAKERRRVIGDSVRKAGKAAKMIDSAVADAELLALNNFEVMEDGTVATEDGTPVDIWLTDMKESRPHWWPQSEGAGASGNPGGGQGGTNPWSKAGWNMTAQGKYVREHGMAKAEQMAKAAGSKVGATSPAA